MADVVSEGFLHVPIEAVFEALTEPMQIKAWSGLGALVDPHLGGAYELEIDAEQRRAGEITTFVRPTNLAMAFEDGAVQVALKPALGGTEVALTASASPDFWGGAIEKMRVAFGQPGRW